MALGDIAGAKSAYQESFETFRKNDERSKSAYPLVGLGDVYSASGDFTNAKKSYEESLAISREAGEKHEAAVALASLGEALMHQGDLAGAGEKIREAINLRNELGEKSGVAEVSLLLAKLAMEEGHASTAESSAREALATFRATKMPELEIQAQSNTRPVTAGAGKENLAQTEIAQGKTLAAKTQQRLIRLRFEMAQPRYKLLPESPRTCKPDEHTRKRNSRDREDAGVERSLRSPFRSRRSGIEVRQPGDGQNARCRGPEGCRRFRVRAYC